MAHYVAQFLWVYLSKVMRTYDSTVGGMLIPVVHNLFRPRATIRFLNLFGGQTSVTT